MQNNNIENFAYTGKNVPVSAHDMYAITEEELNNYDQEHDGVPGTAPGSPYNSPIIVRIGEDRMIQIPVEIQKKAIELHMQRVNQFKEKEEQNTGGSDEIHSIKKIFDRLVFIKVLIFLLFVGLVIVGMANRRKEN